MKIGVLIIVLGLVLMSIVPGNIVMGYASGHTEMKDVGANSTNATEYLQGVANRIMIILGVVAGVAVAVLWVWKVAIPYFSHDSQKKEQAKENMIDAFVATLIIAMAVGGMIWLIARWIAGV